MSVISFAEASGALRTVLESGSAGLVLGAGASLSSGGPTWEGLLEAIRREFPRAPLGSASHPFDIGDLVCETPEYGRADLVSFVRTQFQDLTPSNAYQQLPRVKWGAIFTTNYDDLVEQAYRSRGRVQDLQAWHLEEGTFNALPREAQLSLFYLMGSIHRRFNQDGSPVVSWGDFYSTLPIREGMLELVKSVLFNGGKFIYVGYSFDDFLFLRVLETVLGQLGRTDTNYGFALMGPAPGLKGAFLNRLQSRKIIPVQGTFEEFAELLDEIATAKVESASRTAIPSPARGRTLRVAGQELQLPPETISVLNEYFEVLSEEILDDAGHAHGQGGQSPKAFLEGADLGWQPYTQGWAFKRDAYSTLLGSVSATLESGDPSRNEVVLVHGPAGLGKSVLMRQLAHDLYRSKGVPVLVARPAWRSRPDPRLLDRFFLELHEAGLADKGGPGTAIVVDQAELIENSLPHRILRYLATRGRPVVFVLFARTNEYFRRTDASSQQQDLNEVEISDSLSEGEAGRLVKHLAGLGIWDTPRITAESFWKEYAEKHLGSSFFEVLYELIEPSREPLKNHIQSEYYNLSPVAQTAYRYIAGMHQYGLMLKMEVLMRLLDLPFQQFRSDVIQGDAQKVLLSESQGSDLNIHFRGRTRMVSELVFADAVKDGNAQLQVFKDIVGASRAQEMFGADELDAVRALLVQVLGPRGHDTRFSPAEVAELFEAAVDHIDDDVLEHHCGLAYREAGQPTEAKRHLERSLSLSAVLPIDHALPRESRQHIENSLAVVTGELSVEALKRGDAESADALFAEAQQYFSNSRTGSFPNAAAFDAHARLLRERADLRFPRGSKEQTLEYAHALAVLDTGIDSVNADYRPDLVALRAELLAVLGDFEEAISELASRAEAGGNANERARYHVLLGHMLLSLPNAKGKHFNRALTHGVDASDLDPSLFDAWKLRAKAYSRLHPADVAELLRLCQGALQCDPRTDDIWLLYNGAVAAFALEDLSLAFQLFGQLRRASRGHERQNGVVEFAGERTAPDEPFEYTGRVVRRAEGRKALGVETEELGPFSPVYFNPHVQRYYTPRQGDTVSFVIGFNYRGVSAEDLRKL